MLEHIVCSFVSSDRIGLIDDLSLCISISDGNWLESNMSKLSGQFAGIVLISILKSKKSNLIKELKKLKKKDIIIHISENISLNMISPDYVMNQNDINLTVVGNDRPGIIQGISHALNISGINILNMQTYISSAPMSAENLFNAEIMIQKSKLSDIDNLKHILSGIADDLSINIDIQIRED